MATKCHLMVGQKLYGYCGGIFGRDSYNEKRVEGIGVDWIVARDEYDGIHFAEGPTIHDDLMQYTVPEKDEEDD